MSGSNRLGPYLRAYHGSPYDFQKFEDKAIGSGEGAQIYGMGHYLAEARDTGATYMRQTTASRRALFPPPSPKIVWVGNELFDHNDDHQSAIVKLRQKAASLNSPDITLKDYVASVAYDSAATVLESGKSLRQNLPRDEDELRTRTVGSTMSNLASGLSSGVFRLEHTSPKPKSREDKKYLDILQAHIAPGGLLIQFSEGRPNNYDPHADRPNADTWTNSVNLSNKLFSSAYGKAALDPEHENSSRYQQEMKNVLIQTLTERLGFFGKQNMNHEAILQELGVGSRNELVKKIEKSEGPEAKFSRWYHVDALRRHDEAKANLDDFTDLRNAINWYAKNQKDIKIKLDPKIVEMAKSHADIIAKGMQFVQPQALPSLEDRIPGRLYELAVKADPKRMLHWDRSIEDHPAAPRDTPGFHGTSYSETLVGILLENMPELQEDIYPKLDDDAQIIRKEAINLPRATGKEIYGHLSQKLKSPAAASKALLKAGIHGIRYLDQLSRNNRPYSSLYLDGKPVSPLSKPVATPGSETEEEKLHEALAYFQRSLQNYAINEDDLKLVRDAILGRIGNIKGSSPLREETEEYYQILKSLGNRITIKPDSNVTYNYVIFDPDMIQIVRKYDLDGKLVEDYGIHFQETDEDPFKGENK